MDPLSLTDDIIAMLLQCPKQVTSKRPRETPKAKHIERNIEVSSLEGGHRFTLLTRQSTVIADNYSCGLLWHASTSNGVMLTRYNGSDHEHANPIEGDDFSFRCHIHRATERYIAAGRKFEHFALPTERYNSLDGALVCLMNDCNISWAGLNSAHDERQGGFGF